MTGIVHWFLGLHGCMAELATWKWFVLAYLIGALAGLVAWGVSTSFVPNNNSKEQP